MKSEERANARERTELEAAKEGYEFVRTLQGVSDRYLYFDGKSNRVYSHESGEVLQEYNPKSNNTGNFTRPFQLAGGHNKVAEQWQVGCIREGQ